MSFVTVCKKRKRVDGETPTGGSPVSVAENRNKETDLWTHCVSKLTSHKEDEYDSIGNIAATRTRNIGQVNRAAFRRVQRDIMAVLDAADDEMESSIQLIPSSQIVVASTSTGATTMQTVPAGTTLQTVAVSKHSAH